MCTIRLSGRAGYWSVKPNAPRCAGLLEAGFSDVFRRFETGPGFFSWWDYRQGGFRRNHGLRIDLILAATALAERCRSVTIDREPRRAERASDHTPVLAEFDI